MMSRAYLVLPAVLAITAMLPARGEAETPRLTPEQVVAQRQAAGRFTGQLNHPDLEKVREAVTGLAEAAPALATPYLWRLYERGDSPRRRLALEALVRLRPAEQDERFYQACIAEPLWALRRLAADAWTAASGKDTAAQRLATGLDEKDPVTGQWRLTLVGRMRTAQVLGHVGGGVSGETLIKLLESSEQDVACAAAEGLGLLGNLDHATTLIGKLGHNNPEVRPAIADGLQLLTGESFGFDRVQWERWLEERRTARDNPPEAMGEITIGETDEAYRVKRKLPDPYQAPLEKVGIDFCVIFDTTASMVHIWPELSIAIDAVLREIDRQTPSARMGSVRYRAAHPDQTLTYLIKPFPLSRDTRKGRDEILDASFGGGSGGLHIGIQHAIAALNWRATARKIVLIVGDTTPTGEGLAKCVGMIKEGWEEDRIVFNTLFVRTIHGEEHKPTYQALAAAGGGRFYEYNKSWSHLVDMSAEKVDVKTTELPTTTYAKWLTPKAPPQKQ